MTIRAHFNVRQQAAISVGLGLSLFASAAVASEEEARQEAGWRGVAPAKALEISTGSGFSKGFGAISEGGVELGDVASAGTALQLGVGYRLSPRWLVGVYGEGALYQPGYGSFGDRRNFASAAGVQAQWHALPFARWDPWFGAGAGWRGYWMVDDEVGTTSLQGVDLARLQLGLDCHFSESFLLSPTLGLAVSEFFGSQGPHQSSFHAVGDPRPTMFLSFGTMARFDIGGVKVSR